MTSSLFSSFKGRPSLLKKVFTILGFAFTLFISQGQGKMFNPKTLTLENGFQVVLVENHLSPVVSLALMYKVGTADDPVDMVGLSHFLEHLMFKGTKKVPLGEFSERILQKGGSINAYTTPDLTCYTCDISVKYLDMMLEMEADRMQNLVFTEKETQAEQKVVMEERKMRLDNNPLGAAHESVQRALHKYHPYGIPPIGYPHHILAYTEKALRHHYETWYVPNNAILVVTGDVTMETLEPLVKKHFGSLPACPLPPRQRPQDPPPAGIEQVMRIENPRISYVSLDFYYPTPCFSKENLKEFYAIILLCEIMGRGPTSRLYKDLVEERHLALGVSLYQPLGLDPQHLTLSATLHPQASLEELRDALKAHLESLLTKGVTTEELRKGKKELLAELAYEQDGLGGVIDAFRSLAFGFSVEEIENYPEAIEAITEKDILEAARKYLTQNPALITEIYPQGYAKKISPTPQKAAS